MVPAPVSAIPRLLLSVNVAVVTSMPPLNTSWPAVALAGAVPNPESSAIDSVPPLMVVMPLYVLIPENVSVPAPDLVTVPLPEMTPANVRASERLMVSAALLTMLPEVLPVVPPAPMLSVPPLMVVIPV